MTISFSETIVPLNKILLFVLLSIGSIAKINAQIAFELSGSPSSQTVSFSWSLGDTFTTTAANNSSSLGTPNHPTIGEVGDFSARESWGAVFDFGTSILVNNAIENIGNDVSKTNGYLLRFSSDINTLVGGSPINLVGVFLDADFGASSADFALLFDTDTAISTLTSIVFPSSSGTVYFTLPGSDTFSIFAIGTHSLDQQFDNLSLNISAIPESSTYAGLLGGIGLIWAVWTKRRKRGKKSLANC